MHESPDARLVVSLEGSALRAVACGREESIAACAEALRGDFIDCYVMPDMAAAERVARDIDGCQLVGATRAETAAWVRRCVQDVDDDVRDSGHDGPDDDGDVLAAA